MVAENKVRTGVDTRVPHYYLIIGDHARNPGDTPV